VLVYPGPAGGLEGHAEEFARGKALPENFHLVVDPDYTFTNAYDLRWDAPKETAYPSTFVVGADGKVAFAKVSHTHGDRAKLDEVLRALDRLKK
jgi:peroxiredoxin